jgi:hypothetical protein
VLDASPRAETRFVERDSASNETATVPADTLPGLELACVFGVSDSEKFRRACQEFLAVANEVWSGVRGFIEAGRKEADALTEAPRLRTPELPGGDDLRPRRDTTAGGEIYFYGLPEAWRAADRVAPNMGLAQDVAVMSWLPAYSERLLEVQPLQVEGSLADAHSPLAVAAYLNFAGIIDAVQPWLERLSDRRQERLAAREAKQQETRAAAVATPQGAAPGSPTPPEASPRAPQARAVSPRAPSPTVQSPAPRAPKIATQRAPSTRVPQPPQRAAHVSPPNSAPAVRGDAAATLPAGAPRITPEEARERLQFTLDLLRCIRSFSLTTHQEGDALVTQYELRIQDLRQVHPAPTRADQTTR